MFCIFSTKDGFDESLLPMINVIPYPKVLFSNKSYNYEWCFFLPEFKDDTSVGDLTQFVGLLGFKYYDKHFDFVKWLNSANIKSCRR